VSSIAFSVSYRFGTFRVRHAVVGAAQHGYNEISRRIATRLTEQIHAIAKQHESSLQPYLSNINENALKIKRFVESLTVEVERLKDAEKSKSCGQGTRRDSG